MLIRYYSEGAQLNRGDLKQLAATLNNSLKRSPGAYARAFLFCWIARFSADDKAEFFREGIEQDK
jgi:hypothetical protein